MFAAGLAIVLPMTTGLAAAQGPANTDITKLSIPEGYSAHHSVDFIGRIVDQSGSGAMYNTLVNLHSGPRVSTQSFDLHKLESNKTGLVDNAHVTSSGFGGDPYNFVRLTAEKGKAYDFTGQFRRNRQYFDYDLLGNPNNPNGLKVAIGPSSAPTGSFAWPQVQNSTSLTNSVRRMTDVNLTVLPLSVITLHFGFAQNVMEGPSLLPARAAGILKYSALLQQYLRHSTDQYTFAIDWKPVPRTIFTFEQIVLHNKENSYFTLDPNGFLAQEANGTPVYLGNWNGVTNGSATPTTSYTPYSSAACNSPAVAGQAFTGVSSSGVPIIDPTCSVVTSYTRTNPTRMTMPTETLRVQSASIKNLAINGQFSYSSGNLDLPNYSENGSGLNGAVRTQYWSAYGSGKREVYNGDLGVTWQVTPSFSLANQFSWMSNTQNGSITYPSYTRLMTPTTPASSQSINYSGTLTSTTTTPGATSPTAGVLAGTNLGTTTAYFGLKQLTNIATASWAATPRANFALSYRYGNRNIGHNPSFMPAYPVTSSNDPDREETAITEQAGIFNAAYRVTANWDINGTVEAAYNDNSYTTATPRQVRRYRVHTRFRPVTWANFTAAFNDAEKHNNTFNTADDIGVGATTYYGQLKHEEHTRAVSFSGMLTANEHLAIDFDYAYLDVYTATNTCYTAHNSAMLIGTANTASSVSPIFAAAASLNAGGAPQLCRATPTSSPSNWFARMYADAPTQYGSAGVLLTPTDKVSTGFGYRINSVGGDQFFIDARDVNGAMDSKYQTPYVNVSWKMSPALIWKAQFDYYGYGEGGPSGAKYCTLSGVGNPNLASSIVPCASMSVPTGMNSNSIGMTAPRNFHSNNLALGVHYEF